jgi:hypothetical protein
MNRSTHMHLLNERSATAESLKDGRSVFTYSARFRILLPCGVTTRHMAGITGGSRGRPTRRRPVSSGAAASGTQCASNFLLRRHPRTYEQDLHRSVTVREPPPQGGGSFGLRAGSRHQHGTGARHRESVGLQTRRRQFSIPLAPAVRRTELPQRLGSSRPNSSLTIEESAARNLSETRQMPRHCIDLSRGLVRGRMTLSVRTLARARPIAEAFTTVPHPPRHALGHRHQLPSLNRAGRALAHVHADSASRLTNTRRWLPVRGGRLSHPGAAVSSNGKVVRSFIFPTHPRLVAER